MEYLQSHVKSLYCRHDKQPNIFGTWLKVIWNQSPKSAKSITKQNLQERHLKATRNSSHSVFAVWLCKVGGETHSNNVDKTRGLFTKQTRPDDASKTDVKGYIHLASLNRQPHTGHIPPGSQ